MCLLDSLTWDECNTNPGGMQTMHAYGEIGDVLEWPEVIDPDGLSDSVTIADDIVMKPTKQMYDLYTTMDTAEVKDESVGEIDGKSFESTFEFFHPGSKAKMMALASKVNNGNFFFVVKEADGQKRLFGSPAFPAKIDTSSITTAKDTKGRKGWTAKFRTRGSTPVPIYTGAVPLSPAP